MTGSAAPGASGLGGRESRTPGSTAAQSVSVVIAAYDEAPTLSGVVDEVIAALEAMHRDYEIIIIDDGSTDGTSNIADALAALHEHVTVIHHGRNRGMGGVYRSGFAAATKDVVSLIAADGQAIPDIYYPRCLPPLDGHDMVIGKVANRQGPPLTLFFAWAERVVLRVLLPGVPKIEGPFMFRRGLLGELDLTLMRGEDSSWTIMLEILIRAIRDGRTFATVAVERRPRRFGCSRANTWRNAIRMSFALAALRWKLTGRP